MTFKRVTYKSGNVMYYDCCCGVGNVYTCAMCLYLTTAPPEEIKAMPPLKSERERKVAATLKADKRRKRCHHQ